MKRLYFVFATFLVASLVLASCGKPPAPATQAPATEKPVVPVLLPTATLAPTATPGDMERQVPGGSELRLRWLLQVHRSHRPVHRDLHDVQAGCRLPLQAGLQPLCHLPRGMASGSTAGEHHPHQRRSGKAHRHRPLQGGRVEPRRERHLHRHTRITGVRHPPPPPWSSAGQPNPPPACWNSSPARSMALTMSARMTLPSSKLTRICRSPTARR